MNIPDAGGGINSTRLVVGESSFYKANTNKQNSKTQQKNFLQTTLKF